MERLDVVNGPPAGVLVILTCGLTILGGGVLGFVFGSRWLRKYSARSERKL